MASPYTSVTVENYNTNAPPDDGSNTPDNEVTWAKHKEKIGDPLKTAIEAVNTNVASAVGKMPGGATIATVSSNYTVLAADQGKTLHGTVSGITFTTPAAATVTAPFPFEIKNDSDGDITLDGNGSETVDGVASITIPAGGSAKVNTDGSNWKTTGRQQALVVNGAIINGTLSWVTAASALTVAVKTLAGNDPSVADPVYYLVRNATANDGTYLRRAITAALSIVVPSGATLGVPAINTPFKVWGTLLDEAGTARIGVFQTKDASGVFPLNDAGLTSAAIIGTGSDAAGTHYANNAVTTVPMAIIGYAEWSSGLATVGAWTDDPTIVHIKTPHTPLPGTLLQPRATFKNDTFNATPGGNTFIAVTGLSVTITPTSTASMVLVTGQVSLGMDAEATVRNVGVRIVRGGTDIGNGAGASNRTVVASSAPVGINDATLISTPICFLDDPQTVAATAYQIEIAPQEDNSPVYVNRGHGDSDIDDSFRGASTVMVQEIVA